MLMVSLLALLFVFGSATKQQCSKSDTTLLKFIKWQMNLSQYGKSKGPENCSCKSKEKQSVAFHARLDKSKTNLPAKAILIFDIPITNEGGAYNYKTGKFTCPEDVLYSFSWTILSKPGSRFNSVFVVDGKTVAYNYNQPSSSNYNSATQSAVVKLKKGSKAWIGAYSSHGYFANENWSSFCGFRV